MIRERLIDQGLPDRTRETCCVHHLVQHQAFWENVVLSGKGLPCRTTPVYPCSEDTFSAHSPRLQGRFRSRMRACNEWSTVNRLSHNYQNKKFKIRLLGERFRVASLVTWRANSIVTVRQNIAPLILQYLNLQDCPNLLLLWWN